MTTILLLIVIIAVLIIDSIVLKALYWGSRLVLIIQRDLSCPCSSDSVFTVEAYFGAPYYSDGIIYSLYTAERAKRRKQKELC